MRFTKMHGRGDDFIVVDEPVTIDAPRARALCDRHVGIGADGIVIIGAPIGRRWPLVIHNSDGSVADVCGNGSRCVALHLLDRHGGDEGEIFVADPGREDLIALATASAALAGPANVAVVAAQGAGELALRVHKRGVAETLACGTGSCPAVAAAIARGDVTSDTVRVKLPSGTLIVRPRGERYELAGPAEYVFQGEL
ncbi:MAG TPA: hypothetical protein VHG53_03420 [Candidatus Limnocylindria bacterium]|nr:hypothetical protein [Candidatus Limnocylindria bacterium]